MVAMWKDSTNMKLVIVTTTKSKPKIKSVV